MQVLPRLDATCMHDRQTAPVCIWSREDTAKVAIYTLELLYGWTWTRHSYKELGSIPLFRNLAMSSSVWRRSISSCC